MSRLREWTSRIWGTLRPDRLDRELEEELRQHLEFAAEEARRRGDLPPREARALRLRPGGVTQAMEAVRAQRGIPALDALLRDVRYGVRQLARNHAFTTAAVATLALGIGATTTMFSVLNAVLFRPLPYEAPERLVMLWTEHPSQNVREGRSALRDVADWKAQSRTFADFATFDGTSRTLTGTRGAEQVASASLSTNLLPLLGVQPLLGRNVQEGDVQEGRRVVLVSHRFWQSRFGGSPEVLGASLVLDTLPYEIVGVLPADFDVAGLDADVWDAHASRTSVRGSETWFVVGRLRPGVTLAEAEVEMRAVAGRLNDALPSGERSRTIGLVPLSHYLVGPRSRLALWMLAGTVLCVFLIAAANVTSLSLARSVARAQEIGVRRALGASTGRIVQQLVTESVLLACVSGTIGTGLAFAAVSLVRTYGPSNLPRLNEASVDLQVLAWALGVSLMAGVLVGLPSAVATLRRDVHRIGGAGTRGVTSSVGARRVRRALVVAEFALAIVLLVGAGLFVRSWWNVTSLDTGFRPARVLMMELAMPAGLQAATAGEAADTLARRSDLYRRVLEQVRAAPGVEDAGFTGDLFIDNDRVQVVTVERDADTMSERLQFVVGEASASFFSTMGTRVIRGRTFSPADGPDRARVVIINEAMARRSWPGGDAVGRRLKLGVREASAPWLTVVGVVANMRRQGPEREPFPQMFVPFTQSPPQSADLMVRLSSDNPMASADAIREAVRRVATDIPVYGVAPLEERLGAYVAQRRFQTVLLAAFSIAALLMAAVGIYGLVQYSVATRTQEIGLRMAIGAGTGHIFRMILSEGLSLSLTGVAIGLAGAWMLGRAAASLLFGVAGSDPLTFGAVSLVLTTVAVLASYFPARRAMRVDPTRALRAT